MKRLIAIAILGVGLPAFAQQPLISDLCRERLEYDLKFSCLGVPLSAGKAFLLYYPTDNGSRIDFEAYTTGALKSLRNVYNRATVELDTLGRVIGLERVFGDSSWQKCAVEYGESSVVRFRASKNLSDSLTLENGSMFLDVLTAINYFRVNGQILQPGACLEKTIAVFNKKGFFWKKLNIVVRSKTEIIEGVECLVLDITLDGKDSLFEDGNASLWMALDDSRTPVKIQIKISWLGKTTATLKSTPLITND